MGDGQWSSRSWTQTPVAVFVHGDLLLDAELVGMRRNRGRRYFFFESLLTSFDSLRASFESFLSPLVIVVTCDVRSHNCVASSTSSTAGASSPWEVALPLLTTSTRRSSLSISLASWRRPTRQRTETSWRKAMRLVEPASATRACSTIVSIWSSALTRLDTPDTVGPDLHGVLVSMRPPCGGSVADWVLVDHAPTPTLFADERPEQPGRRSRARRVVS